MNEISQKEKMAIHKLCSIANNIAPTRSGFEAISEHGSVYVVGVSQTEAMTTDLYEITWQCIKDVDVGLVNGMKGAISVVSGTGLFKAIKNLDDTFRPKFNLQMALLNEFKKVLQD